MVRSVPVPQTTIRRVAPSTPLQNYQKPVIYRQELAFGGVAFNQSAATPLSTTPSLLKLNPICPVIPKQERWKPKIFLNLNPPLNFYSMTMEFVNNPHFLSHLTCTHCRMFTIKRTEERVLQLFFPVILRILRRVSWSFSLPVARVHFLFQFNKITEENE